ncbi:MAG TPA: hypothetical protein VJ836_01765 [Candidatus Saccharimonadales bacterium]|nr:hypothetical protein [Candidatus Saccharimonadales bacterium]
MQTEVVHQQDPIITPYGVTDVDREFSALTSPLGSPESPAPGLEDPMAGFMESQLAFADLSLDQTDVTGQVTGTREITAQQMNSLMTPQFAFESLVAAHAAMRAQYDAQYRHDLQMNILDEEDRGKNKNKKPAVSIK